DNKVAQKPVTAEGLAGPNWVVTAGLADGDRVIVSGTQKARPGTTVAVSANAEPADVAPATADAATSGSAAAH
ncbi:MAG TPA: hypothetical protein VEC10_08250, partial [Steroidobacteraceae bacterium]|nr:hypothetical protein [Steroidobacteraceae bacterium]